MMHRERAIRFAEKELDMPHADAAAWVEKIERNTPEMNLDDKGPSHSRSIPFNNLSNEFLGTWFDAHACCDLRYVV